MRRALVIIIAVLAVMLVLPTTMPLAKSSQSSGKDSPNIISTPIILDDPMNSGGGDGGDADDIAGYRGGDPMGLGGPSAVSTFDRMVRAWWLYLHMQIRVGR